MILYVTKKTKERLKLPFYHELDDTLEELMPVALPEDDDIYKWGVKIFYFQRKKCLQIINFASKFCVFLVDVKVKDIADIGDLLSSYAYEIYKDDKAAIKLLQQYFTEAPVAIFYAIKDRSVIAQMNNNETSYLEDGYRLLDYIRNRTLHTLELCYDYNFNYIVGKTINGKKAYIKPGEEFKRMLEVRCG